jgi:hypothetical protein
MRKGLRKGSGVSYPQMSKLLKYNSPAYSWVLLHSTKKFPPRVLSILPLVLELEGKQLTYFKVLYYLSQTRLPDDLKKLFLELLNTIKE